MDDTLVARLKECGPLRFVSLVGFQPTESAVKIQTLLDAGVPLESVTLLHTGASGTAPCADRIQRWADRTRRVAVRPIEIPDLAADSESLEALLATLRGGQAPLVLATDGGRALTIAQLVRALRSETRAYLHSDVTWLTAIFPEGGREVRRRTDLSDLGLDALLDLHGLPAPVPAHNVGPVPPQLDTLLVDTLRQIPHARSCVMIAGTNVPIDVLFECRGTLHALCAVRRRGADGDTPRFLSLTNHPALSGLRPKLAVYCESRWDAEKVRATPGASAFGPTGTGPSLLREWLLGPPLPPGRSPVNPGGRAAPDGGRRPGALARVDGPFLTDELLVALGNDPSATLVSLATHRPRSAYVLYDRETPLVSGLAAHFESLSDHLPAGAVHLVPTDLLGAGIREWLMARAAPHSVVADVSPGSKGQTRALASLADLPLRALDFMRGVSVPLQKGASAPGSLELDGPPLKLATLATGGAAPRSSNQPVRTHHAFYLLLAQWLGCAARPLQLLADQRPRHTVSESCACNARLEAWQKAEFLEVEVSHGGQTRSARVSHSDLPLSEQLIAHLIQEARPSGALPQEVLTNLKWEWSPRQREALERLGHFGDAPSRAELDVAARFGRWILAVECKFGVNEVIDRARKKVEASALAAYGRRAIPILVRPQLNLPPHHRGLDAPRGSVVLELADLYDGAILTRVLERIFQSRSLQA